MKARTLAGTVTTKISIVIGAIFLFAAPVVFLAIRQEAVREALLSLDAYSRTVAREQEQRFQKIRFIEDRAIMLMTRRLASPRPRALAELDASFPLQPDGTRRSRPELFDGGIDADGRWTAGMGAFLPHGAAIDAPRAAVLMAAFDALRTLGEGMRPDLTSLYFYTPRNELIIFSPDRRDRLAFYRRIAPPTLDFQGQEVARNMTPANNPRRVLRCTSLEPMTSDPTRRTWTTGCMTPFDVDGVHVGSWGVSLPLDELFAHGIGASPPGMRVVIVSPGGRLIYHPDHTVQTDRRTAQYLDLKTSKDPELAAIARLLDDLRDRPSFAGFARRLDGYAVVRSVPTPGWRVVVYRSKALVFADAMRAARYVLLTGMVSLGVMIVLLRSVIRRQVGRPVMALAARAEAIAAKAGDPSAAATGNATAPLEIARLDASFDIMEQAVDAERRRLKASFDLLARNVENYGIYMLDPAGRIVAWNRGAERLTGFTEAATLGRDVAMFDEPDDGERASAAARLAGARATGRAIAEGWRSRPDGTRFWAALLTEPMIDERGELSGFAEIVRDETEDRQTRQTLRETVRLLNLAEEAAELGHWRLDLRTDSLFWSPSMYRIRGLSPDQPITQKASLVGYDRAEVERFRALLTDVLARPRDLALTTWFVRPDGERRDVEVRAFVETGPAGEPSAIFGIMRDITEAARAQAEIIAARDAATEAAANHANLLSTMSHEIRTPMTGIIGMLDLVREGSGTLPSGVSLAGLVRSARTMMTVLDDVLDHARIASGELRLTAEPFDVAELVEQTAAMFAAAATAKGIAVQVDAPEPWPVIGDASRVQQVLANLIGNAVKFTAAGAVTVTCRGSADGVRIEVADTGIGIAADVLPTLFSAFRQADAATARTYGGSGLGLAISRRLVEAMGGTLDAESRSGEGSVFRVGLPLARVEAASLAAIVDVPPVRIRARDGRAPHILVADDAETTRQVMAAHLEALGCTATTVGDGAAALAVLATVPVDAVFMDAHMPVLDGAAAVRLARLLPGHAASTPIVAFTASTDPRSTDRLDGCDAELAKPFARSALVEVLTPLVAASRPAGAAPADRTAAMLAELPASSRAALATTIATDAARGGAALAAALADGDAAQARAALHLLKGLAGMVGATSLEAQCRFGEHLVDAVPLDRCAWLGPAIDAAVAALLATIADADLPPAVRLGNTA